MFCCAVLLANDDNDNNCDIDHDTDDNSDNCRAIATY